MRARSMLRRVGLTFLLLGAVACGRDEAAAGDGGLDLSGSVGDLAAGANACAAAGGSCQCGAVCSGGYFTEDTSQYACPQSPGPGCFARCCLPGDGG